MKIQTALSKFLVQLEADGRAESTIAQYERHVRLFAHWCAEVGHSGVLKKITHETLAEFLTSSVARTRRGGGRKKSTTLNTLRTSLKCFFNYIHRSGEIPHDPGRLIRRAVCGAPPPKVLSDSDVTKLLATLATDKSYEAKRDHVLFQLILRTGIRLGSAGSLDVDDVDLDTGILRLRSFKGDREESVFLSKKIIRVLSEYLRDRQPGPLFTTQKGRRLTARQIQRRFSQWVEKAGITQPASVHGLRHKFAVNLLHQTGDIFLVQKALRHKSIFSTLVYAHHDENHLRKVMQSL